MADSQLPKLPLKEARRLLLDGWVTSEQYGLTDANSGYFVIEGPLNDRGDWRVAATCVAHHDEMVLASVTVFPGGDRLRALRAYRGKGAHGDPRDNPVCHVGQWSNSAFALEGVQPAALTTGLLREIRVSTLLATAHRLLREQADRAPSWGEWRAGQTVADRWGHALADEPRRPGRRGRSDGYYALWAARYLEEWQRDSKSPLIDAGARYGKTQWQMRDLIKVARRRGLLTGRAGVTGGEMTAKGQEALKSLTEAPAPDGRAER